MYRTIFLLIAAVALLTACGPQAEGAGNQLAGTGWLLETLNGQAPLAGTTITLNFSNDLRLSGSDGCNQYNAAYTASATTFSVKQPIATTMMACENPVMQQGTAYLDALGKATTYKISGKTLTLSDSGGNGLATFSEQSNSLAGTSWDVISYNNGKQAVVSVMAGAQLTASFTADGNLVGFAGCNDYNATYVTTGKDAIEIGPVASTRKFCEQPAGVMDQETQYLTALSTATTYKIDGNKLELRTADGALAAQFSKASQ